MLIVNGEWAAGKWRGFLHQHRFPEPPDFWLSARVETVLQSLHSFNVTPAMTPEETKSLVAHMCSIRRRDVLEFGCGGSTAVAALCNVSNVHSVDSSLEWLEKVRTMDMWQASNTKWFAYHANIGDLMDWGRPVAAEHDGFSKYSRVGELIKSASIDTVLVDGRFRVACALRALPLLSSEDTLIVHDYERSYYSVIEEFYELRTRVVNLAFFRRKPLIDSSKWFQRINEYELNWQ